MKSGELQASCRKSVLFLTGFKLEEISSDLKLLSVENWYISAAESALLTASSSSQFVLTNIQSC